MLRARPALLSALSSPSSSRAQPPLAGRQRGSAGEGEDRKRGVGAEVVGVSENGGKHKNAPLLKKKSDF